MQVKYEALLKEKTELDEKLKQTIEDLTESNTKELEEAVLAAEAHLNEVREDLEKETRRLKKASTKSTPK